MAAPHCRAQPLGALASVIAAHMGSLPWCMDLVGILIAWDLPRPGVKLMFPALMGRFLTTRSPGCGPKCTF